MNSLKSPGLCSSCADVDLSPLTAPLPEASAETRGPASEYEEQLAVYINDFSVENARRNPQCDLCNLLVLCARRSGEEHALNHKNVCIRPKLVWRAGLDHTSPSNDQGARLYRTGQLHVWFHEFKHYCKHPLPRPPPLNDTSPSSSSSSSESEDNPTPTSQDSEPIADTNATNSQDSGPAGDTNATNSPPRALESWLNEQQKRTDGSALSVKSAVASWMLDVVKDHTDPTLCQRVPIPRHADTTMILNWLIRCDQDHLHSSGAGKSAPRIRHLVARGLLRVINTSTGAIEALPSLAEFVALSYVWGQKREQCQPLKALPISGYASTIRDAATIARSLGFDWLWLDRICIDQGNEAEKSALIPYIKDIFAGASLTIVAASGDGAYSGLPGSPDTARQVETPLMIEPRIGNDTNVLHLLPAPPSFNSLLNNSVWSTRGWTFEEEVFARRLLYMFPSEIIFSCNKGTYRESTMYKFVPEPAGSTWSDFGATPPLIASELNIAVHRRPGNSTRLLTTRQFIRAVEEYTSRDLTIEEDRIKAFAGLVTASVDPTDNISEVSLLKHGHPLGFFEVALTWKPVKDGIRRKATHGKPFAPSWSWASAGTEVHFLDNGEDGNKSDWFRFGIFGKNDIVGLPSHNILLRQLGLDFPTQLINSKPWFEDVPNNAPPSYMDAITTPSAANGAGPSELPILHLVTVVFEARLCEAPEGQHSMEALAGGEERITGYWSIGPGVRSERLKFAVVAGNASIYIMALQEETSNKTFSRLGLLRVSWYGAAPLFSIMKQGHVDWEYLRLI